MAGSSFGYFAASLMTLGVAAVREMIYRPLRGKLSRYRYAPGWRGFEGTLPYDPDLIRQFRQYREQAAARALEVKEIEQAAGGEEPRAVWRGDAIKVSDRSVAVDRS